MKKDEIFSREGDRVKVFLSYSSIDKEMVGKIKIGLETLGLDAFLAHDDIAPLLEWEGVILKALDNCDVLIAVYTKKFSNSEWTNQEIGIALGKGKPVIPVRLDETPPDGFIKRKQALKLDVVPVESMSGREIVTWDVGVLFNVLLTGTGGTRLEDILIDSLIEDFVCSDSYYDAKFKSEKILECEHLLDEKRLNYIALKATENDQIVESYGAQSSLKKLIENNKSKIERSILDKFNAGFNTDF